ncbi:PcfJ domain-containing protein [Azoarcus sp. PA01]|nr:PcfJ domain-containing protein [Azoarcus sp. PA01]KAI5913732.1 PcfJ domain-containing protein [Azoarcus sp. PA01]
MDANRRRASWRTFEQCHENWRYEPARPHGRRRGPAVLRRFETGPFLVHELTTEAALYAEGQAMMHCVASWVGNCLGEGAHVFSVRERRTGARLATLALQADDERGWKIIELKGAQCCGAEHGAGTRYDGGKLAG